MKATGILKKFFGFKEGQSLGEFAEELKAFRNADPEGYAWVVAEAAKALGVEVEQ